MDGIKPQKNTKKHSPFIEIYYCVKCKRPHKRFVGKDKHLSKIFKVHKKHAQIYDDNRRFKHNFKKMWRREVSKRKKIEGGENDCNKCKYYGKCDHQGSYKKDGKWCYE